MAARRPIPLTPRSVPLPRRLLRGANLPVLGLGAIALILAGLISRDALFPQAANTVANLQTRLVALGTVSSAVTGTGTLVPAQQVNVGFRTAGALSEVDVHVGDRVTAGQVLARIDTSQLDVAVQQAQASLAMAQANLTNTLNGSQLTQALHALQQAQQSYTNAINTMNADRGTLTADQASLNADQANYWYTQYQPTLLQFQSQYNAAVASYRTDGCNAYTAYAAGTPCANDETAIQNAQNGINCVQGAGGTGCTAAQTQIAAAYRAVNGDQSRVSADQAKVNADSTQAQAAQFSVSNAQDSYNSQAVNRPATIEQQQAAVSSAQAQVATAQQNRDAATLTAPISGVVSAVNAGVGDTVGAGGSSSGAQAPGTTALLPSSSGSAGGGASTSGSSGGGGSGGFMTLITDNAYEAIVPFAESDAAKIQGGQTGTISFDALNGVSLPIHVLAVAPTSTVTSNVVNYYATIVLDRADSRLRSGLTSNITITTAEASNVLVVPNAAITRLGTQAFVTLLQAGKEVRQAIELGVAGDSVTQVLSGLRVGDRVVLPTRASTTNATTTNRGGGVGGPGGGAGLGLGR